MSSRERWTIYPLLFLALGASLRSKFTNTFDVSSLNSRLVKSTQLAATNIQCDDLVVVGRVVILGRDGKPRLQLGATRSDTGRIEIYGRDGRLVANLAADPDTNAGTLSLQTADGRPQVSLRSGPHGGVVDVVDQFRTVIVEIGSRGDEAGVFVEDPHGLVAPSRRMESPDKKIPEDGPIPRD
jgi:hypothetical protein